MDYVVLPSKHKTFVYNVGPTHKTLGRRCTNVIQMLCVSWVGAMPLTEAPMFTVCKLHSIIVKTHGVCIYKRLEKFVRWVSPMLVQWWAISHQTLEHVKRLIRINVVPPPTQH